MNRDVCLILVIARRSFTKVILERPFSVACSSDFSMSNFAVRLSFMLYAMSMFVLNRIHSALE